MASHDPVVRSVSRPRGKDCTIGVDVGTTAGQGGRGRRARCGGRESARSARRRDPVGRLPRAPRGSRVAARVPARPSPRSSAELDGPAAGVEVTSMVPSITAVDRRGAPMLPGLLYGDARARDDAATRGSRRLRRRAGRGQADARVGDRRATRTRAGYWPCQAVATHALCRGAGGRHRHRGLLRRRSSSGTGGTRRHSRRSGSARTSCRWSSRWAGPPGTVRGRADARRGWVGRRLLRADRGRCQPARATCSPSSARPSSSGSCRDEWIEKPGLISFPSTEPGQVLVGGASNAGALFADWARSLLGGPRPRGRAARRRRRAHR